MNNNDTILYNAAEATGKEYAGVRYSGMKLPVRGVIIGEVCKRIFVI